MNSSEKFAVMKMEQELLEVIQVSVEEEPKFVREQEGFEQIQQMLTQLGQGLQARQVRTEEIWRTVQKLTEIRRGLFHSALALIPKGITEKDVEDEPREELREEMRQIRELNEKMERRSSCHGNIIFMLVLFTAGFLSLIVAVLVQDA
jgi:hypothetical protein